MLGPLYLLVLSIGWLGCSWGTQYGVLLKRSLLAQLRNPTDTTARLLLSIWVGMLAGAPLSSVFPCNRQ